MLFFHQISFWLYFCVISQLIYMIYHEGSPCHRLWHPWHGGGGGDTGTLWGHLSPSNPRHWDTLVKVTQLSSALAAKIQLISSDNHSELRCAPLIGRWDSSLSAHWLRHELLVNLIHDLWYTFPRYWHWHTAHCQSEELGKIISRNLMIIWIYCKN